MRCSGGRVERAMELGEGRRAAFGGTSPISLRSRWPDNDRASVDLAYGEILSSTLPVALKLKRGQGHLDLSSEGLSDLPLWFWRRWQRSGGNPLHAWRLHSVTSAATACQEVSGHRAQ